MATPPRVVIRLKMLDETRLVAVVP